MSGVPHCVDRRSSPYNNGCKGTLEFLRSRYFFQDGRRTATDARTCYIVVASERTAILPLSTPPFSTRSALPTLAVFQLQDRVKFLLERWVQRGIRTRLLFVAGVIVLIAVVGGIAAWMFSDQFPALGDAIWWAFLRLTDPGYLGDDTGLFVRTLSTVITVLGYVVFLGSLVAILTQWLNQTMRHLERGLTPVAVADHVLILGWTNRTAIIARELMLSEGRVRRFLRRRGVRKFRIVILMDEVTAERVVALREALEGKWDERRIVLRSGSSLRLEHLRRVAYRDASVIIIPGSDIMLGGATATDARVIKTLISLSDREDRASGPAVVAEIFDAQKIPVAENSYRGGDINVIASDSFISRLIAQNVRHRGLSFLYAELLSHRYGNEVYVRSFPEYEALEIGLLADLFPNAILCGVVRPIESRFVSHLNPSSSFELQKDDRLVFIARAYEDCVAESQPAQAASRATHLENQSSWHEAPRRVLILGWSHKVMSLLVEFASYSSEHFDVDVLSRVPAGERTPAVERLQLEPERVQVRQVDGDYTVRKDILGIKPGSYDNIVFLASDWMDSEEESDARTILGYVLLRTLLDEEENRPEVLIELLDPENARLFRRRAGEVIISPLILSHILAHVALRRELSVVFNELFGPGGAEFFFRSAALYGLAEQHIGFREIRQAARAHDEIALGIRLSREEGRPGGGVRINPNPEDRWTLTGADELIVLAKT